MAPSRTIHAAMFGGPRAGKTSLLAAMYYAIDQEVQKAGLTLRPELETSERLAEARDQLIELLRELSSGGAGRNAGVPQTAVEELRHYTFDLGNDKIDVARIIFTDYAGERLRRATKDDELIEQLKSADALIVAINTPPMMKSFEEGGGEWHELHTRINHSDTLDALLREKLAGHAPSLVIFSPIKCERWLNEDPTASRLYEATRSGYTKALSTLSSRYAKSTEVWFIPVATVGGAEFSGFENRGPAGAPLTPSTAIELYMPSAQGALFGPRFNEQPLRHVMHHVVSRVNYGDLADPYLDRGFNEAEAASVAKGLLNSVAHWWERNDLPRFQVIKEVIDEVGGRGLFLSAATLLSQGRQTLPPVRQLQ